MGGFLARNRVAVRLALRDARANRGRTTFVAILVALPVLAVTTLLVVFTSRVPVGSDLAQATLGDGAQAFVSSWSAGPITQAPTELWSMTPPTADATVPEDRAAALRAALPPGDSLVRTLHGQLWISGTGGAVDIDGATAPREVADGLPYRTGRAPTGRREVALTPFAARETSTTVGDTVHVAFPSGTEVTATVVGVLSGTWRGAQLVASAATVDDTAWRGAGAPDPDQWWVVGPTPVTWDDVKQINALGFVAVSRAVLTEPPAGVSAVSDAGLPLSVQARGLAPVVAVTLVALLEVVLLIGPAFAVGVRRTERHIALVAAVGGDRRTLARIVRYGGAAIGLGASVIGATVGVGLAAAYRLLARDAEDPFAYPNLRVPVLAILGAVAVGTTIAVAAAWLPSRRAARIDAVAALASRRPATPRRRGAGALAAIALVAGGLLSLWAVTDGSLLTLAVGLTAVAVGLVALSGTLVAVVGLLAPRLAPAGRFAARDADRQRTRTAPAVAAVLAATAGMVTAVVTSQSAATHEQRTYVSPVAPGVVAVDFSDVSRTAEADAGLVASTTEAIRARLPIEDSAPVALAGLPQPDPAPWYSVAAEPSPSNTCPLEATGATGTDGEWAADPRCTASLTSRSSSSAWADLGSTVDNVIIDDGTVVTLMGLPGAAEAAAALRTGHVVVRSPLELWPDGTARVVVARSEAASRTEIAAVTVPAVAIPLGDVTPLILPPETAADLGLTPEVVGLVASTSRQPTETELAAANDALGLQGSVSVETGPPAVALGGTFLAAVATALLVGVGATAVAVALASTDARPDLAVLAAVGASPRTRRRVAGAQAAVVAGLGSAVGTVTGLLLARLLVTAQSHAFDAGTSWGYVTPWPVVAAIALGVPLLAVGGAYVLTPSRLPAVARRIA